METKAVIYDCDGVLFDSRRSNYAFYNHILDHFGMPPMTEDQALSAYVSTTPEALEMLFPDGARYEGALAYAKTVVNDEFVSMMDMEPNLRETLTALRPSYSIAIATNRGRSMDQVLRDHRIEDLFDVVVTSYDVERPKPHPECLYKIMAQLQARPEECVYIGDAEIDRLVAERAGIPFIAYKNPSLRAWAHLEDHLELLAILNEGRRN